MYESLYKDLPEESIGDKIKKYRLIKGMSKVELARAVGLSSRSELNYIGRYEAGGKIPDNVKNLICNVLDFN
ncbi:helix-turn-helix domain-containing protein [Oceanirhabdus sp. W0125-5]|uniref:helix-turn-helix domain-containing protein n=1 Tax=Oceanirhabdus sp. W0125-5 TaxID=2999116 RepID=UPI0022F34390|nr:helix-turn-helix transcriptional regulator [Oceanirhabdus sp. W0125-5]WBW95230.1 helix-turn-helix transcriptional regulator [Oceanirhabdus sp. W0125-5]